MLLRDAAGTVRAHLLEAPYQLDFPRTGRARWGHTLRVTTWALRLAGEVAEVGEGGEPSDSPASLDRAHQLLADLMAQPIGPFDLPAGPGGQTGRAIDVGAMATAGIIHDVAKYDIRPEDAGRVRHAPLGADFAREVLSRTGDPGAAGSLPKPFIDMVEGLIRFHSVATDAQSDEVLRTFGGTPPNATTSGSPGSSGRSSAA